jgi:hypothetical protein
MKNPDLDSLLQKARLPKIPAESLDTFPGQVISRLHRPAASPHRTRNFSPRFAFGLGLAAAALLLVLTLGKGHTHTTTEASSSEADLLASAKFAGETLSLFPHQIRTIVEDAQGVHLVLSEQSDVPTSPPLYIRICDGTNCASFVTFSGQQINVAGQAVMVLSDSRGGIILTGDQFVWSNTGLSQGDDHLKIEAKLLSPEAM